jgi:nitrate reductase gamma subunit
MSVGGCISIIMVILSRIFDMPLLGLSAWTVYFSMYGTRHLYNFIYTKDKIELFQATIGIIFGIACFCGMIVLIIK